MKSLKLMFAAMLAVMIAMPGCSDDDDDPVIDYKVVMKGDYTYKVTFYNYVNTVATVTTDLSVKDGEFKVSDLGETLVVKDGDETLATFKNIGNRDFGATFDFENQEKVLTDKITVDMQSISHLTMGDLKIPGIYAKDKKELSFAYVFTVTKEQDDSKKGTYIMVITGTKKAAVTAE